MSTPPLVSIVIPYYIHEEYLGAAVESALNQTYANLEILVVFDPGKSRPPEEVLRELPQERLRLITQSTKSTAAQARNVGMSNARGAFIVPMDADDLLAPTFLERAVSRLESDASLGGVYPVVKMFGDSEDIYDLEWSVAGCVTGSGGALICLFFRREVFEATGGYNPAWRVGEDADLFIKASRAGFKFARLDEPLYLYRRHPGATTALRPARDMMEMFVNLARDHKDVMMEHLEEIIRYKEERYCNLRDEYEHLHKEFHKLLSQYNQLEQATREASSQDRSLVSRIRARIKRVFS